MKKREGHTDTIITFASEKDMPLLAVSLGDMWWNKTGTWRYIRPLYDNKTAPCNEACPAGEDVEGVEYLTGQGKYEEAWKMILREHPFPAVQGRVCHHPCETACNRGHYDEAIAIHCVERFIGDYGLEHGLKPEPLASRTKSNKQKRIAVVGAGPAGLVCAYHLGRMGYAVTVLEAQPEAGGILRLGIPAYRLPKDILEAEIGHIRQVGVSIQTQSPVDADVLKKDLKGYAAVFLAPGAHHSRKMNIPGEDAQGVLPGLQFLLNLNLGRKVTIGKKVAVIGGGNTAMDTARSALRLGSEVTVVYRRSRAEMPAIPSEVEEAEQEGIPMHFLAAPVRVMVKDGRVCRLECAKMKLGEPDASGRRRPVPVEGSNFSMDVDTILAAIGESADLSFVPESMHIEDGSIATDGLAATSLKDFFAGGDAIDQPRTVANAIGAGKMAAMAIDAALRGQAPQTVAGTLIGQNGALCMERYLGAAARFGSQVVKFDDLNLAYFEHAGRASQPRRDPQEVKNSFLEVQLGMDQAAIAAESGRCFNCGVCNMCENCWVFCPDISILRQEGAFGYDIDYDHCKGCGICVRECPRAAMSMQEEEK